MTAPTAPASTRRRPSIARAVGFVALGWAVVTLVLQVIVTVLAPSMPDPVRLYLPAYRAGQATVLEWAPSALLAAGWTLTAALIVIAALGILFASASRVWIALALVITTALGAWLTAVYAVGALLQAGSGIVSDERLRSVVDPLAIVVVIAVFVTAFFGARLISYGGLGRARA